MKKLIVIIIFLFTIPFWGEIAELLTILKEAAQ